MKRKAIIGITARTLPLRGSGKSRATETVLRAYTEPLEEAGALPLILPTPTDAATARDYLPKLDGILFSGGDDPHAQLFGEEPHPRIETVDERRDAFEIILALGARERGIPVLGICRGIQILNIAFGGDIYQDLVSQTDSKVGHSQRTIDDASWHTIEIAEDATLHDLLGTRELRVNSYHHQACRRLGEGLVVSATSKDDGLIEAIEDPTRDFLVGVQWHPEIAAQSGDEAGKRLISAFVEAAERFGAPAASNLTDRASARR